MTNFILFGQKSSGKSYFGQKLAQKLALPFIDTDQLIEVRSKMSCRMVAQTQGIDAFRKLEREVVNSLKTTKHTIIALGGGTLLDETNRVKLQSLGVLIWLCQNKEVIKKRLESDPSYLIENFDHYFDTREECFKKFAENKITLFNKSDACILEELVAYYGK